MGEKSFQTDTGPRYQLETTIPKKSESSWDSRSGFLPIVE